MGGFEEQRPLSVSQRIQQFDKKLEQIFGAGQMISFARPAARWLSVLDSQQQQQQQQWQHTKSSSSSVLQDVLKQLLRVAAGGQPSPQLQARCGQLAAKLQADMDEQGLPFADWDAAAEEDVQQGDDEDRDQAPLQQQQQQQPVLLRSAAAAGAAAAAASSQPAAGLGPSSGATAGTPTRPQVPAFGRGGDAPASAHMTPSGQQYTRQQLGARSAHTASPGGHLTTFFSMQPAGQGLQPAGEGLQRTAQKTQHSTAAAQGDGQLQPQHALVAEVEGIQAAILKAEGTVARLEGEAHDLQQAAQLTAEEQHRLRHIQQLQQQARQLQDSLRLKQSRIRLALEELQLRELQQQWSSPLQQQQQQPPEPTGFGYEHAAYAAAAVPPAAAYAAAGEGLLRQMGGHIDPVNAIFNPYTAQQGISLSAYAPLQPAQPAGQAVAAAGVVEYMHRLERKLDAVIAKVGPAAAAAAGTAAAGSPPATAQHAGSGSAAAAAAAGKAKQQQPYSFPNFGDFRSAQAAAKWWCTPLGDHITAKEEEDCQGWTPEQLQKEGKAAWRGGIRGHRYQRWAEWVQLMKYLAAKQFELSQDKGAVVSLQDAAAAVDTERGSLTLPKLYKKVVQPWAAKQQQEEDERKRQQQQEEEGQDEEEEGQEEEQQH